MLIVLSHAASALAYDQEAARLVDESLGLIRSGHFNMAERRLKTAIKLEPSLAEAHHNLGLVYCNFGDLDSALLEFETATQLAPLQYPSWMMIAAVQQSQAKIDAAISTYEYVLSQFPKLELRDRVIQLRDGLKKESEKISKQISSGDDLKWTKSRMPLRVFIPDGSPVDKQNKPTAYKPEYKSRLRKAFGEWQVASSGLVMFKFVSSPDTADIRCVWVTDISELGNAAEAGQCEFYHDEKGLSRCLMKFVTKPLSTALPLNADRFHTVCLHEIGHALGLIGHTANPDDVMFYSVTMKKHRKISDSEIKRLKKLYSVN